MEATDGCIPKSWVRTSIGEVTLLNPRLDKAEVADEAVVTFVPMSAVQAESGRMDVSCSRPFHEVKKGYTPFRPGDVLFAKITPCMENGKMAVVPALTGGLGLGSTEFHVLRPWSGIDAGYLYYFVSSRQFRVDAEHNMTGAVGQRRVPASYLLESSLPLPPLNEQRRIVAKIEELFSELDAGVESLKQAREQLKVYRQALLKHAFEGKLTAAWRAANGDKLESADELLARIPTERAERHQRQLVKWEEAVQAGQATGKEGRKSWKPDKPSELRPPTAEELAELPRLPHGWTYVRADQMSDFITKGTTPAKHLLLPEEGEVRFLRSIILLRQGSWISR